MLDEASARLAAIVESSDDAIVSKTLEGVVTSWNAAAARLFGYAPEEMIGESITRIIPPDLQHEEAIILGKVRRGERIHHYETRRCRKDGQPVDVSLTVSPVRDASGRIIGASKIARDITALKAADCERERLLESERTARAEAERLSHLKDEFLATLSHELRTPLNAILGWCALLREPAFRAVNQKQAVETIERNARAQAQIIDDLLDMSRIVSGKIHLEVAPLRLQEVVRAALEAIRPTAMAKRVRVNVHISDGAQTTINGDAARVQQICWNLLTNAVKFTPSGGQIDVTVREHEDQALVIVRDTGIGIATQFLPHVFDRFRQADAGTGRQFGGLGLGLSIVRTLTELHGGTAQACSDGEGHGSTFVVRFPLVETVQMPHVDLLASQRDPLPRLDGRRILIVDDDADSRGLLARVLEERGAHVQQAASANEAIASLEKEPVDAVLSDIGMPGTDGYQFMRQVRARAGWPASRVPAIAVSAYAREEDRRKSLEAGFQGHIAKPYSIGGVLEAVRDLLEPLH